MSEWQPVRTVADLDTLAQEDITEGYLDGFVGAPEPGNNRSRSYWHGWRNGMMDAGLLPHDDASASLAHEWVNRSREGVPQ